MTKEELIKNAGITEDQFYGIKPFKGSLDLSSIKSIPEGFNPTVGSNLLLNSLLEIPSGFNPTVGGSLFLLNVKEIPEAFNPTVGGTLYLDSILEIPHGFNPTGVKGGIYYNGNQRWELNS